MCPHGKDEKPFGKRVRGRLEAAAAGAALLLAGVYGAFVRTATGQR
ncbi:hypothetical protein GCM10010300_53610 [Streptomyces olivaceoviridis]|nr:hypothetical protein GCM10010300_53610 [Streptomyces olivaceoviridis]